MNTNRQSNGRDCAVSRGFHVVVTALIVATGIAGTALAQPDTATGPTFTKDKFPVPIDQERVRLDWMARGYSAPKVAAYPAGWSRGEHTHSVNLIMTLVTGRMEFIFAGQRVVVEPGDELHYPAHTVHAARNIHDGTTQMMESHK